MVARNLDALRLVESRPAVGEVETPISLVNEMLDKLPKEAFTNSTTTFLDPCFGEGTFLIEIVKRLRAAGHSMENIEKRVFGVEVSQPLYNRVSRRLGKYSFTLVCTDSLKYDFNSMKFDVVIGNPPYNQGDTGVNKTIYHKFIDKSISLSKEFVTLVVPGGYIVSRGKKFLPTVSAMNSFGVESITYLNTKDYWSNLTINNLNYFLLNKNSDGKIEDFLNISEEDKNTIEEAKNYSKYLEPFRGGQAYEHSDCVEETQSAEFNTPHITRVNKNGPVSMFSNKKPVQGEYLVVMSERFTGANPANINIVEGSHSLSANVIAFSTNSKEEANRIKNYLESDTIRKYIKAFKGLEVGPFKLADIRKIPDLS